MSVRRSTALNSDFVFASPMRLMTFFPRRKASDTVCEGYRIRPARPDKSEGSSRLISGSINSKFN